MHPEEIYDESNLKRIDFVKKRIAIVGSAPSSFNLAPYQDESWDIWGLGSYVDQYPRLSKIFEIHEPQTSTYIERPGYVDSLFTYDVPVVMAEGVHDSAIVYPMEEVNKIIGREYLTSSIAYMIAMSILEKPEEIGLWGVDLAVDNDEYFHQTPCINAWLGVAIGLGIKVTTPVENTIFNSSYTYGKVLRDKLTSPPFTHSSFVEMEKIHSNRVAQLQGQVAEIEKLIHTHEGSRQAYEHLSKVARSVESGQDIKQIKETAFLK